MSENQTVVRVEGVSKRYNPVGYRPKLRYEAVNILKQLVGLQAETAWVRPGFWALQDVSFSITRGEGVGIIGRNGAGKTTLLRLLSGIMEPTTGHIEVKGRFSSLIGLGAGFDPQRTGRENIYLNAAIFGFSPDKVNTIIDDIIAFAELSEFLDRPVKNYSSGMVARLGFSVAIHIFPDIIFLDEVLSVGDAAFQAKCVERIKEIKKRNCTILFVSHSARAVKMLCERCIWLHHGKMMMDGPADEVIHAYEQMLGLVES